MAQSIAVLRTSLDGDHWTVTGVLPSVWQLQQPEPFDPLGFDPPVGPAIAATVPGVVQRDLERAGLIPDYRLGLNSRTAEWTSSRDWLYRRIFTATAPQGAVALEFDGVDHACTIALNGVIVGQHEGTCEPFRCDVTTVIRPGDNVLVVVVRAAPTEPEAGGAQARTSTIRHWKPRFAYGWDWAPRLVPLGVWRGVRLIDVPRAELRDVWARPARVREDLWQVTVTTEVDVITGDDLALRIRLLDADGRTVTSEHGPADEDVVLTVQRPRRWESGASAAAACYRVAVQLLGSGGTVLDERIVPTGFREIDFGTSADSCEPYGLIIEGTPTLIRGWNWVPVDQYYGGDLGAQYRHAIELARRAGVNLLRVWGGGLLETPEFYELCDRAGILVWQEFLLSSSGIDNRPPEDSDYLARVEQSARSLVRQRRNHPCLLLWCGGNELLDADQIPLDERTSPVLAQLRAVVADEDPGRPFLPATPSGPVFLAAPDVDLGDVHGPWRHLGMAEHHRFWDSISPRLHSEFATEGTTNLATLRRTLPPDALWPPDRTNTQWLHRGSWWLHPELVQEAFGPVTGIETYVAASQWLQFDGLRYAVEASRRRFPQTSGTLPWQFNESFPNAAGTSAVDHYGHPKPAYWGVVSAYGPRWAGARLPGYRLDDATVRAVLCSDPVPGRELRWTVRTLDGTHVAGGQAPATTDETVRTIAVITPTRAVVVLDVAAADADGTTGPATQYLLSSQSPPFASLLGLGGKLAVIADPAGTVTVTNTGSAALFGVGIGTVEDHSGPFPSEGYRAVLLPGDSWLVGVDGFGELMVTAHGVDPVVVSPPTYAGR